MSMMHQGLACVAVGLALLSSVSMVRADGYGHGNGEEPECSGIKSLVVFGDSLSDTGLPFGLWSMDNQTLPLQSLGYYNGHFTNGQVWCEVLAQQHGLQLASFAVGGATVNTIPGAPTVANQLPTYLSYLSNYKPEDPYACVILAGSNDLFYLSPDNATEAAALLAGIPTGIATLGSALLANGCNTLVISNIPPVNNAPYIQQLLAPMDPSLPQTLQNAINTVNAGIAEVVCQLSASGFDVLLLDLNSGAGSIVSNPEQFGLTDVKDPCIVTQGSGGLLTYRALDPTAVLVSECSDPSLNFFWDFIHPTARAHEIIGGLIGTFFCEKGLLRGESCMQ